MVESLGCGQLAFQAAIAQSGTTGSQYPSMKASALSRTKIKKNKKMVDEIEKMHTHLPTDGEGCEGRPQGVHLDP